MLMFTLAISCLTTSNLPWFMDLTYQVPMQYCPLQHWILLLPSVPRPFHYKGLECKSRKSINTWNNRQIWPWNTEWRGERLTQYCQENTLVITLSSKNTREDSTYGHHQIVNAEIRLIILFATKDEEALYSQEKIRSGVDCGSDYELLIVKFRLKLKKVGKTSWPFRYDLNQFP